MANKTHVIRQKIVRAVSVLAAGVVLAVPLRAMAAGNSVLLEAPAAKPGKTDRFDVAVKFDADKAISAFKIVLTFDANKLAADDITYTQPYQALPDSKAGKDSATVTAYAVDNQQSSGTLAVVTFRSLGNADSAVVSIDKSKSSMYAAGDSSGTNVLASTSNLTLTFDPSKPAADLSQDHSNPVSDDQLSAGDTQVNKEMRAGEDNKDSMRVAYVMLGVVALAIIFAVVKQYGPALLHRDGKGKGRTDGIVTSDDQEPKSPKS